MRIFDIVRAYVLVYISEKEYYRRIDVESSIELDLIFIKDSFATALMNCAQAFYFYTITVCISGVSK